MRFVQTQNETSSFLTREWFRTIQSQLHGLLLFLRGYWSYPLSSTCNLISQTKTRPDVSIGFRHFRDCCSQNSRRQMKAAGGERACSEIHGRQRFTSQCVKNIGSKRGERRRWINGRDKWRSRKESSMHAPIDSPCLLRLLMAWVAL